MKRLTCLGALALVGVVSMVATQKAWQERSTLVVTEVAENSLAGTAGFRAGDVIYRVGGVDVGDNVDTAARVSLIGSESDTIINFLRRGRPYRIKLRQPSR